MSLRKYSDFTGIHTDRSTWGVLDDLEKISKQEDIDPDDLPDEENDEQSVANCLREGFDLYADEY